MVGFVLSPFAQALPVPLAVGLIAFALFKFVGDPGTTMLGTPDTEAQKIALIHDQGRAP